VPNPPPEDDTGPHADTYERAERIFWGAPRRFHPIVELASASCDGTAVRLELVCAGGRTVAGRLTFADPHVVRFQWALGGDPGPRPTEMLAGPVPTLALHMEETADRVAVHAGGPPVVLERRPWRLTFGDFTTEPADTGLVDWVTEPGGWAEDERGIAAYETFALRPGEELFGLGERFLGPALRGRRLAHWIDTALGLNTTDRVHKSVPFLVSTRGYGVFAHHSEEGVFDLGALSSASATFLVRGGELDLFVLLGTPKEVLTRYTALTGRAPVPPASSFDPWLSRAMYPNRATVEEVVDTGTSLGLKPGVIGVDPMWLAGRKTWGFDACDFVPAEDAFGPIADLAAWLHERDVRLCLWVNPHVHEDSAAFVPERLVDGGTLREGLQPKRGFVDFTGAGAAWWEEELRALLDAGVDAFKLDYGEMLTNGGRMADGRTTDEVHNLYPLLASMTADRAGAPVLFTRGGTAGSQRYPLHWSGDAQATWAGLAGALRGGLAASWSGFAHWTSDAGGFHHRDLSRAFEPGWGLGPPERELYIRWMQLGMLCSHVRFHGQGAREPWHFGDDAVRVAQRFWLLRAQLKGYLLECAAEAAATGWPVMRPLAFELPDDPTARHVDTEYLLGPALLVCPVLEPGGRAEVYIPAGGWTEVFTGERVEGPRWLRFDDVPIDRIPLYTRDGYDLTL
jgi:alpha-D-xyloside xylohydrolase